MTNVDKYGFNFQRKNKAKEIYDNYISVKAQDAVNIDSVARKHVECELETPTPQTFEVPQQQVKFCTIILTKTLSC